MLKKHKSGFAFLFAVGNVFFSNAQNFKASDPIAVNQKVTKGVLPNGMTYYIYPTAVNKNTASYYIIQNVGSILENDQQKGLAHFLEHMAFNGTKHFEGKGILNTLQKQGAIFGKNINAYTSTDETVYNLDNIPSKDGSVVDTCLLVLHDWSNFLSLTNEEIDAERGVITEEWRTRQDAGQRIYNQLSPAYYNNCLYAQRAPIGDMNIVKNFDYQVLKDFYKDWYRPDLQAIAIVGDINAVEIEEKIKKLFADIPAPQNPKKRFEIAIPENETSVFKLALDKEISNSGITYMIRHTAEKSETTYADLEKSTQRSIAFSILNNRLDEMAQKQECPFKSAQIGYQNYSRLNDIFYVSISPKPNMQAIAFTAVMNEWIRVSKFGFSKGEIERAVAENISGYENYLEKQNEISHKSVIGMVKNDYLKHEIIGDPKAEFEMVKVILSNLDTKILQEQINQLYTAKNRVVAVTGVENENNLNQELAFDIINKAENDSTLQPYVDSFVGKSLMGDVVLKAGKIVSEQKTASIDATTYVLSNGVKVHYRFADKNKKDVKLKAESFGGISLYDPKDMPSVSRATSLAMMSGLGSLSNTDLEKVLKGKIAGASVEIDNFTETVSGSANVKDIETMMQLVHLRFAKPRFDADMFALLKQRMQNSLKNKEKDIRSRMGDSLTLSIYGKNNPKIRLIDQKFVDDLSFDKMKSVYFDRFADVANFEFYIVGDVTPEVLKPLLEKYIASISGIKRSEKFKDNTVDWVSNKIDKDVFIKMETPKSSVRIKFLEDYTYSQKNRITASFLGDILTLRYTESLREKEGGTYGAQVSAGLGKLPKPNASLSVSFDCDANKVEQLLPIVYQEIEKIKKGNILSEDLEKTRTNYIKARADSKDFNAFSMDLIYNYFHNDYNMDDPKNYLDIVKSMSDKDIQDFANSFLKKAKSYEVVFKPLL
ncbi:M16 family metallopeptidase [Flavobacterium marginilacus]|uniref:M16 family metallopeptidase n=1 Tax=Flavobacterium marginilacus TaxID=3003256 RepID=UPI00248DFEEA|nr:M16 family metallopeptidase [Flavobacterium marginilacus]